MPANFRTQPTRAWPVATVAAIAACAALAAIALSTAAHAGPQAPMTAGRHSASTTGTTTPSRALADEAFATGRYAEAYGRYAALADRGDATSAWMALMLVTNGAPLYGSDWSATPGQLQRWRSLAFEHAVAISAQIPVHDRGE